MNWETVYQCMQKIAGMKRDAAQAIVLLRAEVIASTQLSVADKAELQGVLDGLQSANLYRQISLVGRLKTRTCRPAWRGS